MESSSSSARTGPRLRLHRHEGSATPPSFRGAGLSLILLLAAVRAGAAPPGPGPLPWRVGGRLGFTSDAVGTADSAGYILEVYTRIPPATLGSLGRDVAGQTRLRLSIRLRSSYGSRLHDASQEFGIEVADSSGGFGKVVVLRLPTKPGRQQLEVRLDDLNTHRHGWLSIGRKVNEYSSVEGEIDVPAPQAGRYLSDLELIWREAPAAHPNAFVRGERIVVPNAERLFGLYENDVRAMFTARGDEGRAWRWVSRVLDPAGHLVAQQESTAAAGRWLTAVTDLDVTQQPAGGYDLEVKAWQEGDAGASLRRAHFGVAWKRDTWQRSPRDIEDTVHFLLSADDEDAFALLNPGEQERYLDDFWRARDPTPDTGHNEALQTFLNRVAYANANYSRAGIGKGMFSDMGRTYIRYGPPNEIYRQVVPAGDETLRSVVTQLSLTEDRPVGDITRPGLGGDVRPWEVWIYDGNIPLPPDTDPKGVANGQRKHHLVFLFVDEQGLGDYRTRYSTE